MSPSVSPLVAISKTMSQKLSRQVLACTVTLGAMATTPDGLVLGIAGKEPNVDWLTLNTPTFAAPDRTEKTIGFGRRNVSSCPLTRPWVMSGVENCRQPLLPALTALPPEIKPPFRTRGEIQTFDPGAIPFCPGRSSPGEIGMVTPPIVIHPATPPKACWNDVTPPQTFDPPPGLAVMALGEINWPLMSSTPSRHLFDPTDTEPRSTPAPMVKFIPPIEMNPGSPLLAD